jgi:uncharacterized protein YjbJ (UPF0337 family)
MGYYDSSRLTGTLFNCSSLGNLTGDSETQAEGQAKQVEAAVRHTVENMKDKVKEIID